MKVKFIYPYYLDNIDDIVAGEVRELCHLTNEAAIFPEFTMPLNLFFKITQIADTTKGAVRKSKPANKNEPAETVYPANLNVEAWHKWLEFRKQAKFKSYKSDAPMKKLAKMGDQNEQMLIVQQSIDNEYQGLFEIKSAKTTGKTAGNFSACEDFING